MNQSSLLDAIRLAKEQGVTLIVISPDEVKTPAIQITGNHFAERSKPTTTTNSTPLLPFDPQQFNQRRGLKISARNGPYEYPRNIGQPLQAYRFGVWLTEQMNKHGLSDKSLGSVMYTSSDGIRHLRHGRNVPRPERQEALERYFAQLNAGAVPPPQPAEPARKSAIYLGPEHSRDSQRTAEGMEFGRWITELMNRHALTDRQMERATGIPHGSFGKMRTGGYIPNRLRINKLIEFFAGLGTGRPELPPTEKRKRRVNRPKRAPGGPYSMPKRGPLSTDMSHKWACWMTEQMNKHGLSVRDVVEATDIKPSHVNAMRMGSWFPPSELRSKVEALFEEKPVASQASS